jgi:hypothetical protein
MVEQLEPISASPTPKHLDQGGLRSFAEALHYQYGTRISCPNCSLPDPPTRAYCRDEGGNGVGGLKRRQFRCRNTAARKREVGLGCSITSCESYIERAVATIGVDTVETVRQRILEQLAALGRSTDRIATPVRPRCDRSRRSYSRTLPSSGSTNETETLVIDGIRQERPSRASSPATRRQPLKPLSASKVKQERSEPSTKRRRTSGYENYRQIALSLAAQARALARGVTDLANRLDEGPRPREFVESTSSEGELWLDNGGEPPSESELNGVEDYQIT